MEDRIEDAPDTYVREQEELSALKSWFRNYDMECNKLRRRGKHAELTALDTEAEVKAARIKVLRTLLTKPTPTDKPKT